MGYLETIPKWTDSKTAICNRIARNRSSLKIVLKTKDEELLLRRWIEYYSKMVGIENIIIFDNNSTSEKVESIYSEYSQSLNVIRYTGFVDLIHDPKYFPELYEALRYSSDHFAFFDTDEYLVWASVDGKYFSGPDVVELIATSPESTIFPSLWLNNVPAYTNRVWFFANDPGRAVQNLKWGKPIIASTHKAVKRVIHNVELIEASELGQLEIKTNCLLLHLNRLSSIQRINSNINKLRSHQILTSDQGLADALKLNANEQRGSAKAFVEEIKALNNTQEIEIDLQVPLQPNALELSNDGLITAFAAQQSIDLSRYLADGTDLLRLAFSR